MMSSNSLRSGSDCSEATTTSVCQSVPVRWRSPGSRMATIAPRTAATRAARAFESCARTFAWSVMRSPIRYATENKNFRQFCIPAERPGAFPAASAAKPCSSSRATIIQVVAVSLDLEKLLFLRDRASKAVHIGIEQFHVVRPLRIMEPLRDELESRLRSMLAPGDLLKVIAKRGEVVCVTLRRLHKSHTHAEHFEPLDNDTRNASVVGVGCVILVHHVY